MNGFFSLSMDSILIETPKLCQQTSHIISIEFAGIRLVCACVYVCMCALNDLLFAGT